MIIRALITCALSALVAMMLITASTYYTMGFGFEAFLWGALALSVTVSYGCVHGELWGKR